VTALTHVGNNYTVTVPVTDTNADGTLGIVIGSGVKDVVGNEYAGGASPLYTVRNWFGFATQPSGTLKKYVDGTVTYGVTLDSRNGSSIPTYQWWGPTTAISGKSTANLTLGPPLTTSGSTAGSPGDYWCVVTYYDTTAQPSTHATLQVKDHVAITLPAAPTMPSGSTYTFTATPTGGYTPYTYRWFKGASVVQSGTSTSYVANSAGTYKVEVTDANSPSADIKTSNDAVLTVTGGNLPVAGVIGLGLLCGTFLCGGAFVVRRRK